MAFAAAFIAVTFGVESMAFDTAIYTQTSVLATGKWARVNVETTGMQFISNSQLSSLGFSDPSKVNVYGYGGRLISETLSADMPDDLPLLPCVRTPKGILFYGVDNVDWQPTNNSSLNKWAHVQHAYSFNSYYFLSDRAIGDEVETPTRDAAYDASLSDVTTFTCHTLHERDMAAPSNSGRTILGEDFRSPNTRSFSFTLRDMVSDQADVQIDFGGSTTSTWSLTAWSDARKNDRGSITQNSNNDAFMQRGRLRKTFATSDGKLDLNISFSGNGTTTLARLDFIEVEWERHLRLADGQLHFYDTASSGRNYVVDGCSEQTRVWDVTNPARPVILSHTYENGKVKFSTSGIGEYIVFNPESGMNVTLAGRISNQDIHSLETPDMLIITPAEYLSPARRVAALHEQEGMRVHVLTPDAIYNEFSSGVADVSAFRKLLKMWQDRAGDPDRISYCLLFGKPTYDNRGATEYIKNCGFYHMPIWQSSTGTSQSTSYSTDDFIGMVDDPKGTFNMSAERISVAVGRFPVISLAEANAAVDKLESYMQSSDYGSWRNSIMLLADDGDEGEHLRQAETGYANIIATNRGYHLNIDRLYLDTYTLGHSSLGAVYPEAKEHMLNKINDGVIFWEYIGHANPVFWGHENIFTWQDMENMRNKRLPFLYAATCEYARWDADDRSGGEELWLNPKGGVIGMICPSRSVYISYNGPLTASLCKYIFDSDDNGMTKRIGHSYIEARRNYMPDGSTNAHRYCFIGDPALRLPNPVNNVVLETIDDVELSGISDATDFPVIKARQRVAISGKITDNNGELIPDFNGSLEILMLDAEKVVTTNGNNSETDRAIISYNDRNTVLYKGKIMVQNGKWRTTVLMPPEVENNYAPGRLIFYASSDTGVEASGSNQEFYVYGYNNVAAEDHEGPEIRYFALNRRNFANGDVTHTTPVVLAKVSDPSGINVSDAGLGHKMMLTLDGTTIYTDVNNYYTPDMYDLFAGDIVYPMPELTSGNHTLKLTVWDNANNSSSQELNFNVSVTKEPSIYYLTTDCNPASTSVVFQVNTDRPMADIVCTIEVFDLNGRRVWSDTTDTETGLDSAVSTRWDLTDMAGHRVPRGIYVYRATIAGEGGVETTQSRKLAVTAP